MKILFVAHFNPLPANAGNRARILSLVRELVGLGHEVHYAILSGMKEPGEHLTALKSELGAGDVYQFRVRRPQELEPIVPRVWRKLLRMIGNEGGFRVPLDHRYDPTVTPQLRALQQQHAFDVVFVEYVFTSKAFEAFPRETLRVLDTHDVFGDRHRTFLKAGLRPSWFATTTAEEEAGLRRADAVIAIQEEEARDLIRRLGADGGRVHTISHIMDLSRRIASPADAAAFIGGVNAVNSAALRFLIDQVLPRVRQHRPTFKLLVAGPISAETEEADGIERCGLVDHVADLYARAPLLLNAMILRTGINIKLLEAMACGVPVISTEIGAGGLDQRFRHGVRTVPDQDPEAFAAAILELAGNDELRRGMGEMAFADAVAWNEEQRRALRDLLQLAQREKMTSTSTEDIAS